MAASVRDGPSWPRLHCRADPADGESDRRHGRDVPLEITDDRALIHRYDPVAELEDFCKVIRDQQDRATILALANELGVNEGGGADIQPARRLGDDQNAR